MLHDRVDNPIDAGVLQYVKQASPAVLLNLTLQDSLQGLHGYYQDSHRQSSECLKVHVKAMQRYQRPHGETRLMHLSTHLYISSPKQYGFDPDLSDGSVHGVDQDNLKVLICRVLQ